MKDFLKQLVASMAICLVASACSQKSVNRSPASKPQFTIAPGDLIGFATVTTNSAPSGAQPAYVIHLRFTNTKAEAFRQFTHEHINQQVQLSVGSEVVAEPFINAEVPDGRTDLSFASPDKAHAVANLLAKRFYETTGGGKVGNDTPPAIHVGS